MCIFHQKDARFVTHVEFRPDRERELEQERCWVLLELKQRTSGQPVSDFDFDLTAPWAKADAA